MEKRIVKLYAKNNTVPLKVVPGHFATNHSHVNYYIDMTTLKTRLSEAGSVAASLAGLYMTNTIVDTIVCLDGTQVIGTLLAQELTRAGYLSMNAHGTIYVVTPEYNSNSQMIFRDNIQPMIQGKHVIVLMASVTTGITIQKHGMHLLLWRHARGNIRDFQRSRRGGRPARQRSVPQG